MFFQQSGDSLESLNLYFGGWAFLERPHSQRPLFRRRLRIELQPQGLRTSGPLTLKNALNPKFVRNLSRRLFFGVPIRGARICQKLVENLMKKKETFSGNFQIFDYVLTNSPPPLIGIPKNNRREKFWTSLGFRASLNAARGRRNSRFQSMCCTQAQSTFGRHPLLSLWRCLGFERL